MSRKIAILLALFLSLLESMGSTSKPIGNEGSSPGHFINSLFLLDCPMWDFSTRPLTCGIFGLHVDLFCLRVAVSTWLLDHSRVCEPGSDTMLESMGSTSKPIGNEGSSPGHFINSLFLLDSFSVSLIATTAENWNILNQIQNRPLGITLKNYCESWRMNVELHNIWDFEVVPAECTEYIGKYMSSSQYKVDSKRAIDECTVFLSTSCSLKNDGKDAWIFDIDDTLLSTVPYYKQHNYGGEKLKGEAPVLEHTKGLFNVLKAKGVKIFLISGRREHLRAATVDNLLDVEIHGWTDLILRKLPHSTHHGTKSTFFEFLQKLLSFLRGPSSKDVSVKQYKIAARKQLIDQGYRILGIVGSQWSSIDGLPTANRTFKLPNSIYHIA